jgi:hypothetical protein
MVEDKPEDIDPSPDAGRAKRAAPTIDLEATDVSAEAPSEPPSEAPKEAPSSGAGAESKRSAHRHWRTSIASATIAAVSGACAAALVLGLAWLVGWPGDIAASKSPAAPAVSAAAVDDLTARIASLESKTSKPASVPDPGAAARIDALDKSVGALRAELEGLRKQSEKLVSLANEPKPASGEPVASTQLSEINERIAALETTIRAQSAAVAQESAKAGDEVPLRRIVAAALLDVLVRTGDPYPTALATAKSLAPNADALKPLEAFAETGVPSAAVLSRDLLSLVPKLSPPPTENAHTGTTLIDRLQAGAAKLVRIERTDAVGNERGNVVARVTAAALRNDFNEARRELKMLTPADRAPAQGWIDKADARDAALTASRQFAAEAMTALAKPAP